MDERFVQIIFTEETEKGTFRDAIYVPMEEYPTLTEAEIDAQKQERVENFITAVNTPAEVPIEEPVVEE